MQGSSTRTRVHHNWPNGTRQHVSSQQNIFTKRALCASDRPAVSDIWLAQRMVATASSQPDIEVSHLLPVCKQMWTNSSQPACV